MFNNQREQPNGNETEKLTAEQKQIIEHGDGNIIVTASAGSGKTFTMIERAKRLIIENKATIKELLAVTFTEKAAFEMKEKLKNALLDKIAESGDKSLINQVNDIATADICTLHAFCGRLIRNYFYAVGCAPDFKILDESDAQVLIQECIDKVFKDFYEKGEEWFLKTVDRYAFSRTDERLKELIKQAYYFCSSEADPESITRLHGVFLQKKGIEILEKIYKEKLNEKLKAIKKICDNAEKHFRENGLVKSEVLAKKISSDVENIINASKEEDIAKFNPYSVRLDFDRNLQGEALVCKINLSECRDRIKKLVEEYADLKLEKIHINADEIREQTDNFARLVRAFMNEYAKLKEEENVLDFNDLEHFALKILSDEKIRNEVSKKYKYIFVDEYQDTNGVQESILSKIQRNNILMVGDVKQSIYGFRGCRPEIFSSKTENMQLEGQKVVRLNDNFRSATAVIDCVNEIFDYCMVEEYFGESYKKTSRLKFGGGYPNENMGRATLHYLEDTTKRSKGEEEPRIYDILKEAGSVVKEQTLPISTLIGEIIDSELENTYYDLKDKTEKQIQLSDIVILTRNRNNEYVRKLVKGLNRRGIDVISDVKENVCDFPEITILVNALKLVDCFEQDVPLAATLKSPIGNFSMEELFEIVNFYEDNSGQRALKFTTAFFYYLENACTPLRDRLNTFKKYVDQVRFYADFAGAKETLKKIVDDNDLEGCYYLQKGGRLKVQRIHRFISAGERDGKILSVREFLDKVEGAGAENLFGFAESGDKKAVTVMTIHASKGLEFPVVIVCGLERGLNKEDEKDEIYFSRKYGFGAKYFNDQKREKSETLLRSLIKEEMREERVKEEMRLFYVATTRAKYSLHLTFTSKKDTRKEFFSGAEKFIDYVPDTLPVKEHVIGGGSLYEISKQPRRIIIGEGDAEQIKKMQSDFSIDYPYLEETLLPLKTDVTSATQNSVDQEYKTVVLFNDSETDVDNGNTAHKIMECFDFLSRASVSAQAQELVKKGVISQEQLDKIKCDRMQTAINSGVFNGIKEGKLYREKPFIVSIEANRIFDVKTEEEVLLQGIIDLLAVDGDNAYVIDYKYSKKDGVALKERYAKQLELYAYAVEKVLNKKVVSKTLVNLFTGEVVVL